MKRHLLSLLALGLTVCVVSAQDQKPEPKAEPKTDFSKLFKNDKEKFSYAIGMSWATGLKGRLKSQDIEFDADMMAKAFKDALAGAPLLITEEQDHEALNDLNKSIKGKSEEKRKQQAEEAKIKGEKNKAEGEAFLAKNKTAPGVITLPSGLQYKVLTPGTGPMPAAADEVTVNYRGTLIDGTEFDSSTKHGKAFTTRVQGGVIKGWSEALQLMKTGSKWTLYIPADLAYGPNPAGPMIAPNAVLIFDIELLSVQAPPTAAAVAPHSPGAPLTSDIIKVPSAEEIKKGAKIETIKAEDLDKEKAKANK